MIYNVLYHWMQTLMTHLPALSQPKQRELAQWVIARLPADACLVLLVEETS